MCTAQADVEQLVALIAASPAHGRAVLCLGDGGIHAGVVRVRESIQVFRDPGGREGMNAQIILEYPGAPDGIQHLHSVRCRSA